MSFKHTLTIVLSLLLLGSAAIEGSSAYFGNINYNTSPNALEKKILGSIEKSCRQNHLSPPAYSSQLSYAAGLYTGYMKQQGKIAIVDSEVDKAMRKAGSIVSNQSPFAAEYSSINQFINQNLKGIIEGFLKMKHPQIGISVRKNPKQNSYFIFVILADRLAEIDPFPARPGINESYSLKGKLAGGMSQAEIIVTPPQGEVIEIKTKNMGEGYFEGSVSFNQGEGVYQLEVIGKDASGPHIAALFPVLVGEESAAGSSYNYPLKDKKYTQASEAEKDMLILINYDRKMAGLPPLRYDAALAAMARGHSQDMASHDFFAHVSPYTGDLTDRAKRAGIPASKWTENISLNRSLIESEKGLMASPGHRKNILDPEVTHVGIGAVITSDNMYITQNFAKLIPKKSISEAKTEILNDLNAVRVKLQLPPLLLSEALSVKAQNHSRRMAAADDMDAGNPLADLEGISFSKAASNILVTAELADTKDVDSLKKEDINQVGIGVVQEDSRKNGAGVFWITLIFTD